MNKLIEKIQEPMMKLADKFNSVTVLAVMRDSFFIIMPIIIFGSLVTIIGNFPFLDVIIGKEPATWWKELLSPISNATLNSLALFITIGIGYNYAKVKRCDTLFCAAMCVSAFFILAPWFAGQMVGIDTDGNQTGDIIAKSITAITTDQLGAKGMFVAILSAFFSSAIFCSLSKKNLQIKMPAQVPPAVAKSFASLIPIVITLSIFTIVRILFSFTPWGNLFAFIYEIVQAPLTTLGSGVIPTAIAVFFVQFFWFFGLHGQVLINSVFDGTIWLTNAMENAAAFNAGDPLPHIVTKTFMETYTVGLGGSGATLIVVILIVLFARSKQFGGIGKLALAPGIFNVNEPFIFGIPIILNPLFFIPWIIIPIINFLVAYYAMWFGLVPYTTGVLLPWTTPIFLNGFLATNSWQGAALQLAQLIIDGVLWLPFIVSIDTRLCKQESTDRAAKILNAITAATMAKNEGETISQNDKKRGKIMKKKTTKKTNGGKEKTKEKK